MAELLGVISGVASLFSLAIEAHRVCADYIAGVRGASTTVRNLLDELKAIKAVLGELDLLLDRTDKQVFLSDGTSPWFNLRDTSPCRSILEKLKTGLEKRLARKTFRDKFSSISWPFAEDETRQALQSLRHYHSVYEAALSHDIFRGVTQTLHEARYISHQQKAAQTRKILQWLSLTNMWQKQDDILSTRYQGTGQWLLEDSVFLQWLNKDSGQQILWCPGAPGAGKTVISSVVMKYLTDLYGDDEAIGLAIIFCDYKNQTHQTSAAIIAAIIKQLVAKKPRVPTSLFDLYSKCDMGERRASQRQLSVLLNDMCASYTRVFILVDGLDECYAPKERDTLLQTLKLVQGGSVKTLITSRPNTKNVINHLVNALKVQVIAHDDDITSYVSERVEQITVFSEDTRLDLKAKVVETITRQASGMFLVAILAMDRILAERTTWRVMKTLDNISSQLDDTYEDLVSRIKNQQEQDSALGMKVLQWITHAKRPLTSCELCHALAVDQGNETEAFSVLDRGNIYDAACLVEVCAGLVHIEYGTNVIQFVHATAYEFFMKHHAEYFPDALIEIPRICLLYLSFKDFASGYCPSDEHLDKRLQGYPFLDYAAHYWGDHLMGSVELVLRPLAIQVLLDQDQLLSMVQVMHIPDFHYEGYSQVSPRSVTPLHVTAFVGLSVIGQDLIDQGISINALNQHMDTSLQIATLAGHMDMVRVLLEHGADLFVHGQSAGTPLQRSAARNYLDICELLLARDAGKVRSYSTESTNSFNAREWDGSPLILATDQGHLKICQVLLLNGAEVDSPNSSGRTSLHMAAANGNRELVQLLLSFHANSQAQDVYGATALQRAAANGHHSVCQTLLAAGCNPNAPDFYGSTSLQRAAANGYDQVCKLLLISGADPNVPHQFGGSALQLVAAKGRDLVARILLEHGAMPDQPYQYGGTALQRAAANGHYSIAKLLLEAGAVPDSQNSTGGTPLQWAAANDHVALANLLLSYGANPNCYHRSGVSALQRATAKSHEDMVNLLLENEAVMTMPAGPNSASSKV